MYLLSAESKTPLAVSQTEMRLQQVVSLARNELLAALIKRPEPPMSQTFGQPGTLAGNRTAGEISPHAAVPGSPETPLPDLARHFIFDDGDAANQVLIFNRGGVILSMPLTPHLEGANIFRLHDRDVVTLYQALALGAISSRKGELRTLGVSDAVAGSPGYLVGFAQRIPEINAFIAAVSRTRAHEEGVFWPRSAALLAAAAALLAGMLLMRLPRGAEPMDAPLPATLAPGNTTLENILEYGNEAAAVVQNGLVVEMNVHFAHLLGRHRHETFNTPFVSYVHPEDRENAAALAADSGIQRHIRRGNLRLGATSREYLRIHCIAVPVQRLGEPACILWLDLDSAREQVASPASQQTPISVFMNRLPMGMAVFDGAGRLETANQEWFTHWSALNPEADSFNIYESALVSSVTLTRALSQAFGGRDGTVHAYEYTTPQGEQRWLQIVFRPLFTDGEVTGVCMLQTDITVQMRSHKREQELAHQLEASKIELTRALEHFQNLVDANPATVIGVDRDGIIRTWNTGAEKRFDILRGQAIGQPLAEASPALARHSLLVNRAIQDKMVLRAGKVPSFKEGISRYEDVTVYPFSTRDRDGAFVSIDDVTTRTHMEEQHVQKEKLSSFSVFAAGLAHEMNNPLGVVLHGAQNLRRRLLEALPANEKAAGELGLSLDVISRYMQARNIPVMLEQMEEAGMRSASLVSSLVRFSTGANSPLVALDIPPLLERCVRMSFSDANINLSAQTGHINIEYIFEENLPKALCAPEELEQAFSQIISNSIKSLLTTLPAGVTPIISICASALPEFVRIVIRDNGGGMPDDVKKRVFDPFFTTAEHTGEGVGLGLPLAYFIITTLHQGSIDCESSPGQGAAFTVSLRRADKSLPSPARTGVAEIGAPFKADVPSLA